MKREDGKIWSTRRSQWENPCPKCKKYPIDGVEADQCANCWEVERRIDDFLVSERNRDFVRAALPRQVNERNQELSDEPDEHVLTPLDEYAVVVDCDQLPGSWEAIFIDPDKAVWYANLRRAVPLDEADRDGIDGGVCMTATAMKARGAVELTILNDESEVIG